MGDTCLTRAGTVGGLCNPGQYWRVKAAADFNNDNKVDLLFQHDLTLLLKVWLLDETSYSTEPTLSHDYPGIGYRVVGTGDFNNDGFEDILFQMTAQLGKGTLMAWFMNGTTRQEIVFFEPKGWDQPSYEVVATGEFGTYGGSPAWHTDILFQDPFSRALKMWFMSGTNCISTMDIPAPAGTYKVVGPR